MHKIVVCNGLVEMNKRKLKMSQNCQVTSLLQFAMVWQKWTNANSRWVKTVKWRHFASTSSWERRTWMVDCRFGLSVLIDCKMSPKWNQLNSVMYSPVGNIWKKNNLVRKCPISFHFTIFGEFANEIDETFQDLFVRNNKRFL